MSDTPIHKRANHCFISYGSEDVVLARTLADWLASAGLNVWFDEKRLGAGAPVLDELVNQISNSRAFLLILTETALTKPYVKYEVDHACQQQVTEPGFALLAVRTDPKLDPTARFPALGKLSWANMPESVLDISFARRLLLSLTPATPLASSSRHVFVSTGWGETEEPVMRRVCAPLAKRGVRLVGDATDQKQFSGGGKARVQRIMSGCTGHLMVLPARRSSARSPEETYKYFLDEWEISRRLRLARRVFCVDRTALPRELQMEALEIGTGEDPLLFERQLIDFHDEIELAAPYAFLASDYKHMTARNEAAKDVIQHVLGMECWQGKDYPGDQVREEIVDKVVGANLVFADLACRWEEGAKKLSPNLNTCIEAGIAWGARRPVFVTALDPECFDPQVQNKTTQLPFMFRNHMIQWYGSSVEFLAKIHRLAWSTRRRIINAEIQTG